MHQHHAVLLVSEPRMRRYTQITGSPLDGCDAVRHLEWSPGNQHRYEPQFDEALSAAEALGVSPWWTPGGL